jgi:phosphoadenosine phosphosulfate reductase
VTLYARLANRDEPFDALIDRVGLTRFANLLTEAVPLSQGEWTSTVPEVSAPRDAAEVSVAAAALESHEPRAILQWALEKYGDSLLVTSALGAGGVLLAQYLKELAPAHASFLIDTGKLFEETHAYYRQLREEFGLNLVAIGSGIGEREFAQTYGERLWERDPNLCCHIRKVQVLGQLRKGKQAWVAGLRREQGGERESVNVLEREFDGVIKVQPLALVKREWIDEQLRTYGLPQHPLFTKGFRSVGCEPCTVPVGDTDGERDGRWTGKHKTECGLHSRAEAATTQGVSHGNS